MTRADEEPFSEDRAPKRADVVIIGAGVIGLSLALELAYRGVETVVLERGLPGDRATSALGAAAGLINPQAHPGIEPEPVRDLGLLSRHLYADWIASIEEEAGVVCEYDVRGGLTVARTDAEEVQLDRALDWQRARGLPFEVLTADEAREREPALGGEVRAAFAFPLEGQISTGRLARALALAVRGAGAHLVTHAPVLSVLCEAGRLVGVESGAGRILAGAVVNAAGAWAGHVGGVPPMPIVPVRGQMVRLDASADPDRLTRFAFAPGVYLVPRRDGSVVIGSTFERAGFDARPTASGIATLLDRAVSLVPAAADYPILETWGGLRPASPDDIPLMGESVIPGYFLSGGHLKNGILLAPASAVLMADLLTGQTPPLAPAAFSPARFDL
ncbi:MAG: glycine oxidase ThiO [Thermoanaerobaculia bacterium]